MCAAAEMRIGCDLKFGTLELSPRARARKAPKGGCGTYIIASRADRFCSRPVSRRREATLRAYANRTMLIVISALSSLEGVEAAGISIYSR